MELISRTDAIKDAESWVAVDEYEKHLQKIVVEWLKEFPSAQLSTDCISRQAAIDVLDVLCQEHRYKIPGKGETYSQYNEAWQDALDRAEGAIGNLPSAEPQIVRCKDCKHWIPYDWMFSEIWQSKNIADYPEDEIGCDCCDMAMKANDFCSRAERREVTK